MILLIVFSVGTILSNKRSLNVNCKQLPHVTLTTILGSRDYYLPHFTTERQLAWSGHLEGRGAGTTRYWSLHSQHLAQFLTPGKHSINIEYMQWSQLCCPRESDLVQPLCWSFGYLFSDPVLILSLFCLGSCTRDWCANGISQTPLPTGFQLGSASGKLSCGSCSHRRGAATARDAAKNRDEWRGRSTLISPFLLPFPPSLSSVSPTDWMQLEASWKGGLRNGSLHRSVPLWCRTERGWMDLRAIRQTFSLDGSFFNQELCSDTEGPGWGAENSSSSVLLLAYLTFISWFGLVGQVKAYLDTCF